MGQEGTISYERLQTTKWLVQSRMIGYDYLQMAEGVDQNGSEKSGQKKPVSESSLRTQRDRKEDRKTEN